MMTCVVALIGVTVMALVAPTTGDPSYNSWGSSRRRTNQAMVFEDEFERANKVDPGQMPISLARKLSAARDLRGLVTVVDRPMDMMYDVRNMARNAEVPLDDGRGVTARFGGSGETGTASGNKNGEMAVSADCKPELTTVPLGTDKDSATIYWPTCTRIERCGGCCSHQLLSCKPTASETIYVQVIRAEYSGSSSGISYTGIELVPLERHTACQCGCKHTAQDCNRFQEYLPGECRCKCINKDDFYKCSNDDNKLWDPNTCRCACKTERECSTGHYYDLNTCSCKPIPVREARPFDVNTRFFNPFKNFYNSDTSATTEKDQLAARHADISPPAPSDERSVRVRGPIRSNRYDERERRMRG